MPLPDHEPDVHEQRAGHANGIGNGEGEWQALRACCGWGGSFARRGMRACKREQPAHALRQPPQEEEGAHSGATGCRLPFLREQVGRMSRPVQHARTCTRTSAQHARTLPPPCLIQAAYKLHIRQAAYKSTSKRTPCSCTTCHRCASYKLHAHTRAPRCQRASRSWGRQPTACPPPSCAWTSTAPPCAPWRPWRSSRTCRCSTWRATSCAS